MIQPPSITDLLTKVAIFLLPFFIVGFLLGFTVEFVLIGVVAVCGWHYWHLFRTVKWIWFKSNTAPERSSGIWGQVYDGLFHLQRKHKQKRKELSQLVYRFRQGAESLPDAVVVFTSERTIVWCNSLAQNMMGFKMPDDIGNRLDNFLRHPQFIEYLEKEEYDEPFEFSSPLDDHVTLECRIAPFQDKQWTLIARDVTQLRRMEQMRKDFIANVSHELRTPLTVMRGYLEMLPGEEAPSMAIWPQAQKMMSEQALRMDALVEQLMTLTRLENTSSMQNHSPINCCKLLKKVLSDAKALSNGDHTITLEADPELWLISDPEQMRSAFSNLAFNAVKYTPKGGTINLSWQKDLHGNAVFKCQDNGDGIAPEHLARLTERFYRIDEARQRDNGGSGLGLSIVNRILQNHESSLQIESQRQVGSTFSFTINKKFAYEPQP